ncbi:hypothetical protein [Paenibacillus sp. J2TS4]|uniref:hypothetical protein n=1 Tax=Paenibacillus sp. J2TS4 TaxID=2807194 RepID=UPI001B10E9D5|nr:hypothetical protein [Paenibacillus sp. J2TS4]GIP32634.1 hypothetical protein J2TS4_18440 [Paenibacillus sp. J2TS4]
MSRKWERMVEKNRKQTDKIRKKQGKPAVSYAQSEPYKRFLGRNWMLPFFLVAFSSVFTLLFYDIYQNDASYWFIAISYFVLGLIIFFLRRPMLGVGKTELTSRRFGGDKTVPAEDIEEITFMPGYVVIQFKTKRMRWVYSRFMHRMDIAAIKEELKPFAEKNKVKWADSSVPGEQQA